MKKLALVIALAVAASWMLSDRPGSDHPRLRDTLRDAKEAVRHDLDRVKRDLARGSRRHGRPVPPAAPTSPEPPDVSNDFAWTDEADGKNVFKTSRTTTTTVSTTQADESRPSGSGLPAWFPADGDDQSDKRGNRGPSGVTVLVGRLSASEERARGDLAEKLARQVREWLAADVAPGWNPPARELQLMTLERHVQSVAQVFKPLPGEITENTEVAPNPADPKASVLDDVYTLYRAGGRFDFSADRKARLVEAYRREVVDHRLYRLGGGMALALVGLAALVGYIRADEATKGFYTNRLRLLTAAGLGASGYAVYQVLARH